MHMKLPLLPLMKLISTARLHHSQMHAHTCEHIKRDHKLSLSDLHIHNFFHLHDGIPRSEATQGCSVLFHMISYQSETRCHTYRETAMQSDPWILTLCPLWLARKQALVLYSETQCCSVLTGEDNGVLSVKCAWLKSDCYPQTEATGRHGPGTVPAQTHTTYRQTRAHKQTCGAVGRVDAQKLQRRLHSGVVQQEPRPKSIECQC